VSKSLGPLLLPDSKLKELQAQYKQTRDRRIAERLLCVILYAQGYDLKAIKRILLVGVRTLKQWLQTFMAHGVEGLSVVL
jgi:transposase